MALMMLLHKQKKTSWPIIASLLVHSLMIGMALSSVSFEVYRKPEGMHVAIVTNISDAPRTDIPVTATSGTTEPPRTRSTPHDDKKLKSKTGPGRINQAKQETVTEKPVVDASLQPAEIKPVEPSIGPDNEEPSVPQPDSAGDQNRYESQEDSKKDGKDEPDFEERGSDFNKSENNAGSGATESTEMNIFFQEVKTRLEKAKQYPWMARLNRQEGTVRLQFTINSFGEAKNIYLIESSRWRLLNDEAVAVIKRVGRFPQPPNSTDIEVVIPLIFRLNLQGSSQ
jgi:TonB family protein